MKKCKKIDIVRLQLLTVQIGYFAQDKNDNIRRAALDLLAKIYEDEKKGGE